ncbi:pentatricopeptide repeat-containing protein At3g53170-like isoform X2 [Vicia villosa]|uniref:pentatricopeptide repeat-containing protein At3g53170-like isoform X2 n=1 Tax=Vicia villosa TaxID=3911 RepID=UPI00273AC4FC|nr:pentatricopeptide repeat-containing protein At3g53170-like isoform X2 [Vicia villosa]
MKHLHSPPPCVTRASSISSTAPITCSTKFPTKNHPNSSKQPPSFRVQSLKRSSKPLSPGLQKDPKKDLSRILRTEAAIKGVENKAKSWKHKQLWPKAVLEALDDAIKGCQWENALMIFELLRNQHWYEPRCQTYTKLLMMLSKCKQPKEASQLLETMLFEGLKPTVDVYTALVLVDMSYLGIECNNVTYNSIIDGYGKAGMFEQMENSLTDMIENENCQPDIFTLNSLIGSYGNGGKIDQMEKWYDEFQLMGIKPDIKTFNMMIKSYGKAGIYDKMNAVMDFMERRFFTPTIVTYNTVVEVYGKAGEIEKMNNQFKKMKHLGMKPNSVTYCSLVSAYSKAGLIDKVDSILRHVENSDVVLDTPFFNCIISAYGQAGDLKKMGELFLAMRERKCKPDSTTFACMIQAYNTQGMTEDAKKMEDMMITSKDSLDTKLIGC